MQKDQRNTVRQFFSFQKFFFFLCCIIKFVKRREYCEAWVYYLKTKKWILYIVIFGRLIFFLNEFLCNARNFRYFFFFDFENLFEKLCIEKKLLHLRFHGTSVSFIICMNDFECLLKDNNLNNLFFSDIKN